MSIYRKVEVRLWGDEKFRCLSPIPPCAQGLWIFMITGPHTSSIPGLFRAGRASMAEELGWEVEDFDEAFQEVFDKGMAKADFKARLMWIPNAIKHNKPASPNVVTSWGREFDLLPECDLKLEAYEHLKASIHALGEAYGKAFDKAFRKPSEKALPKTCPNQKQKQKQKQEQEPPYPPQGGSAGCDENEKPTPTPAASLSIELRKHGVQCQPADPRVIALAEQGIDIETAKAACEQAAQSKPGERIGIGYVIKILERWAAEAKKIDVKGAEKKRTPPDSWWTSDAGIDRKGRELGLQPKPMESYPDYKNRIFEEIRKREAA